MVTLVNCLGWSPCEPISSILAPLRKLFTLSHVPIPYTECLF